MFTILGRKGNAHQNHTKIPPHSYWNSYHQEHHQQQRLARMQETYTADGNVNLYNHFGRKYGGFLKK
jgi:hypothetical protein